jgi:hypothetical protein
VTPVELFEEGREQVYDKEKYREMLLDAAETVLGYFGFDRTYLDVRVAAETESGRVSSGSNFKRT